MALVGYARVSTDEQNLEFQTDALLKAGCIKVFEETISGVKSNRPIFNECLKYLRPGDTLVVWKLDRLGRTLRQIITFIDMLAKEKIEFMSIKDNVDTTTPTGKFYFHINAAYAELERDVISERTRAGLAAARARGVKGGRRYKLSDEDMKALVAMHANPDIKVRKILEYFKISESSLGNYLRRAQKSGLYDRMKGPKTTRNEPIINAYSDRD